VAERLPSVTQTSPVAAALGTPIAIERAVAVGGALNGGLTIGSQNLRAQRVGDDRARFPPWHATQRAA